MPDKNQFKRFRSQAPHREREAVKQLLREQLGTVSATLRVIANDQRPPSLTPEVLGEMAQHLDSLCEHLVSRWVDALPARVIGRLPPDGDTAPPAA